MIFKESAIDGAYIIKLNKHEDNRGFFARSYCENEFKEEGISFNPVQANIGYSKNRNTLRGLHYQVEPHAEAKLVRCVKGKLFDVIVDLRQDSGTYGEWTGVELNADSYTMFYVPRGCAHGYQTLVEETEISYMVSAFYEPKAERGIRWNDPAFDIQWYNKEDLVISEKDQNWPDFKDLL